MQGASRRLLLRIYQRLRRRNGHLGWWPGSSPLEIAIGAILTQNTRWQNVAQAITTLKREQLLSFTALKRVRHKRLARTIYSSGYYNQKAIKLKSFIAYIDKNFGGSCKRMAKQPLEKLRPALLQISGIGKETADSILLYALNKPIFVVDAYTARICRRLGLVDNALPKQMAKAYDPLQQLFMQALPKDVALYNDYHAQFVRLGNQICLKQPKCAHCCLNSLCVYAKGNQG